MKMWSVQNYTTHSRLSGIKDSKDWVERAADLGYEALGICDKQSFGGLPEFQKECKKYDINPVMGAEFLVTKDINDKNKQRKAAIDGVVLLYAKNKTGYQNLIAINNISQDKEKGFYYYPRVDKDVLNENKEGIICIVPNEDGIGRDVENNTNRLSNPNILERYYNIFGDDLYLGLNPMSFDQGIIQRNKAALDTDYKKVFTYNCHFPEKSQPHLYEWIRKLDNGNIKASQPREVSPLAYLPEDSKVEKFIDKKHTYLKSYVSECVQNLDDISDKCSFEIETGNYHMPSLETQTGSVRGDLLEFVKQGFNKKLCPDVDLSSVQSFEDFKHIVDEVTDVYPYECVNRGEVIDGEPKEEFKPKLNTLDKYIDRLLYEVELIDDLGYMSYFHIIRYLCNYIDNKDMGRGLARGSAAGSLFSYLLNITRVDPLRHGLLFERFLNPDRNDLPDIDLDFSTRARDEVKQHVKEKWGEDHVVDIVAYNRLKIKSAITKLAKASNLSIPNVDGGTTDYDRHALKEILKSSDKEVKQTDRGRDELESRIESSEKFENFYKKHKGWIENVVMPLQDSIFNIQIHAAGTLILKKPMDKCMPVYKHSNKDMYLTQYKDRDCENLGNPKFDFLTVEGVNVIGYVKEMVKKRYGTNIPPIEEIPLDHQRTLDVFNKINTKGIFQFRTYAQRQFFEELKPETFEDLVAAVALVRPGPMGVDAHLDYADIKNGVKEPEYDHPDLKGVLEETHGIIVYQEQIMKIVQKIGGLTASEADYVRKACGKKKLDKMKKWEDTFKSGGIENGYSEELVDTLWNKIVEFAEYGFNKSHAVSYVLLSYWQAYLKSEYKTELWASVLRFSSDNKKDSQKPPALKALVKSFGIDIVYPTLFGFAVNFEPAGEDSIYWPLSAIKSIGKKTAERIAVDGRNSYDSMEEMLETVDGQYIHKGVICNLIKAGFFDPIGEPWEVAEEYFEWRKDKGKQNNEIPRDLKHKNKFEYYTERNDMFDMVVKPWKEVAPVHPKVQDLQGDRLKQIPDGDMVFVAGMVDRIWYKKTKYGDWYAKMIIRDEGERHTVMMWSDFIAQSRLDKPTSNASKPARPHQGQVIEFIGEKNTWKDRNQIILGNPNCYMRVIWDELDYLEEKYDFETPRVVN